MGRVTLFPAVPSPPPSALILFSGIWGGDPDSFQRQPNAMMPTIAQGFRHGMSASCSIHPARIDFSLEPGPSKAAGHAVAVIEDSTELQKQLAQVIDVLGKGAISNPIARVALYLQFLTTTDNFAKANEAITSVLPEQYRLKLADDEEDFVFQINRPQMSKQVQGIKLNVLTKWSVERIQVFTILVPAPGVPAQPISLPSQRIFISPSVVFDNSTPAEERHNFGATQISSLLMDAFTLVSEAQKQVGLNIAGF